MLLLLLLLALDEERVPLLLGPGRSSQVQQEDRPETEPARSGVHHGRRPDPRWSSRLSSFAGHEGEVNV